MTHKNKNTWNIKHLASLVIIIGGGLFLWNEHRAHLLDALPYLIFLLCPIMHLFMHKGHGDHGRKENEHDTHQGGAP